MVTQTPGHITRLRQLVFAAMMSLVTVNIVCLALLWRQGIQGQQFWDKWQSGLLFAWPVVFASILLIAPVLMRLTHWMIKSSD